MAEKGKKRRINFYQIQGERKEGKNSDKLNSLVVKEFLENAYQSAKKNSEGHRYTLFETLDKYVIEYIDVNERDMFIRFGKETMQNSIGKRNSINGDLQNIELGNQETIESFTYLYIDLENCVLSFLKLTDAPNKIIFEKYLSNIDDNVTFKCVAITSDDILKKIMSKQYIGAIEYRYCSPKEEALKDVPGVDDSTLKKFDIDKTSFTVRLAPPRKRSIGKVLGYFSKLLENLFDSYGEDLKKVCISARDEAEDMMTYNLMDYHFCSFTYIDMTSTLDVRDFKNILMKQYQEQKKEISFHISS